VRGDAESAPQLEAEALRPETDGLQDFETVGSSHTPEFQDLDEVRDVRGPDPVGERRPRSWVLRVTALAVVGLAMIGGVFALRGGVPGLPKQPPFIAAAQGPTKVQPPSDETVTSANDAGANLLKDSTQADHVKVVASEEQPVDLSAEAKPAAAANSPSTTVEPGASGGSPVKGTDDAPVVVMPPVGQPPVAQQFPDPKPVRTVSLRPDGTPIPPSMVATAEGSDAAPLTETPKSPAKAATKPAAETAGSAQASTPKLDVPTKLSAKSSARVVVAKTDTTAPGAATDAQNEPAQIEGPAKSDKPVKPPKSQQAAVQTGNPAAPAQAAGDSPTAATSSPGWAVQLAAPKSEAEAKSTAARLGAKYESALNGSAIGVHKAVVNGETIYRLRVVGLSKADAASLCARLKGDGGDCFIAK
jgi:hypothetical protein